MLARSNELLKPITQKLEIIADEYVANGQFVSKDAVIADILNLVASNDGLMDQIIEDWKADRLEAALIEGLESGASTPLNFAEIKRICLERLGA